MSNQDHNSNAGQPPQPPEVEKKALFHREQLLGIPLLMLLSILALFGVFGESVAEVNQANETLAVRVGYPTRNRYTMDNALEIRVQNNIRSGTAYDNRAYFGRLYQPLFGCND